MATYQSVNTSVYIQHPDTNALIKVPGVISVDGADVTLERGNNNSIPIDSWATKTFIVTGAAKTEMTVRTNAQSDIMMRASMVAEKPVIIVLVSEYRNADINDFADDDVYVNRIVNFALPTNIQLGGLRVASQQIKTFDHMFTVVKFYEYIGDELIREVDLTAPQTMQYMGVETYKKGSITGGIPRNF